MESLVKTVQLDDMSDSEYEIVSSEYVNSPQTLSEAVEILVGDEDIGLLYDLNRDIFQDEDGYVLISNGTSMNYSDFTSKCKMMQAVPLHPDDWYIAYNKGE